MTVIELNSAPLRLSFNPETLELLSDGIALEPEERLLAEMKPVLFDWKSAKENGLRETTPCYFMHRGLAEKNGFRYDVTILPALKLGREWNKTFGHFHARSNCHSFAEVYEILFGFGGGGGEARFVLEKKALDSNEVTDVAVVKARQGDIVFVPHDYGHALVNCGNSPLVTANWTTKEESDYAFFRERKGAACFLLADGSVVKNPCYPEAVEPRFAEARNWQNPFPPSGNICKTVFEKPELLDFLK